MVFGKKNNTAPETEASVDAGINVFLGAGTRFEGRLEFTGTAQISGAFTGEIVSKGVLVIGQGGKVEGSVEVGQMRVAGELNGTANCSQKALLQRTAVCTGQMYTKGLAMEDGAIFDGDISMGKEPGGNV